MVALRHAAAPLATVFTAALAKLGRVAVTLRSVWSRCVISSHRSSRNVAKMLRSRIFAQDLVVALALRNVRVHGGPYGQLFGENPVAVPQRDAHRRPRVLIRSSRRAKPRRSDNRAIGRHPH